MRFVTIFLLIILFSSSLITAQGSDWSQFEEGNESDFEDVPADVSGGENLSTGENLSKEEEPKEPGSLPREEPSVEQSTSPTSASSSGEDEGRAVLKYTENFYLALWVGGLAVVIVLLLLYLLWRKPKDPWEKKEHKDKPKPSPEKLPPPPKTSLGKKPLSKSVSSRGPPMKSSTSPRRPMPRRRPLPRRPMPRRPPRR